MNSIKLYSTITAISIALLAGGIISSTQSSNSLLFKTKAEEAYNCHEINFGSNVGIANETRMDFFRYESSTINFSFTTYTACGHNKLATGPIRIGGSSTNGHIVLELENNVLCDRVYIYAATCSNETAATLIVNDVSQAIHTTTDENYDFSTGYLFEFGKKDKIDIKNKLNEGRCLISRIVLRTY